MEEIELKDLLLSFWKKKFKILIILLIFAILGGCYSYFVVKPEYKSTTTILVTQSDKILEVGDVATSNSKLVPTYVELIKTDKVLETVVNNINNPDITVSNIKNSISSKLISSTELVEIAVTNSNAEYASKIANEVAKVSCQEIAEIYDMTDTYILDNAKPSTQPHNINHKKDIIIFTFIGVIVAIAYVLIDNIIVRYSKKAEKKL